MLPSKTLCFLFLFAIVSSTPLTQTQAQSFIQANGLVPPTAVFQSFVINPNGQKVIVTYKDGQAGFKFILDKDEQQKPNLLFKEELFSIGFHGMGQAVEVEIIPEVTFQTMPLPMHMPFQMPVQMPTPFNQPFFEERRNQMGHSRPKHRRFENNQKQPCKLNEQQIKTQIKENLQIFKDAEIKEIRKVGFEFGTGLLLEIDLINYNKQYTIRAGYIPRHKKLNVVQIVQVKAEKKQMNPLETGKELIGKVISNMEAPLKSVQNVGLKFENIIQSFVEKLLVRKNLKLGENQQFEQEHPLVGSEGELEMQAPILLGSEGEIERIQQLLLPISALEGDNKILQQEEHSIAQQHIFKQQTEEIHEHTEQKSEEISQLVTEVLSKLKLKTK